MSLIGNFFSNYGNFQDRTRRRDFFLFILVNDLIFLLLLYIDSRLGTASKDFTIGWLSGIWALFMTIPNLAIIARRMHDIGKSGWWLLIGLVPALGVVLVFWAFRNSVPGWNSWGPNPKGIGVSQAVV